MTARNKTRQKMLFSTIELIQQHGAANVTIDAILERSKTPRGSVYYHFPRGRAQIIEEALDQARAVMTAMIEDAASKAPEAALRQMRDFWSNMLTGSDFRLGCPISAVVVSGGEEAAQLEAAAAETFRQWRETLARGLQNYGATETRAPRLASMIISVFEGAVIQARTQRSMQPLDDAIEELEVMILPTLVKN